MKKFILVNGFLLAATIFSCNKANLNQVSLTASTTSPSVGQTVSVTLNSSANASNWSVSPSSAVTKQFTLTTQKINYFTFSQPGNYVVGVRVRDVAYDSTRHQSLDSCWHYGGGDRGNCKHGVDSASILIAVK